MTRNTLKKAIFATTALLAPTISFAQENDYVPLTEGGLPLINTKEMDIGGLLNALFAVSVGIAAVLAVIMLAIGGFRYMTSESVFNMGDARGQISNAIIGLLIVLTSVLILTVVNPDIVKLNLFK